MRYRLRHYTHYHYAEAVDLAHNQMRMLLREAPQQTCLRRSLRVRPGPAHARQHLDHFGNQVLYFEIATPHRDARIFVTHEVEVTPPAPLDPMATEAWDLLAGRLARMDDATSRQLNMFRIPSSMVAIPAELAALTAPLFVPGRPIGALIRELSTFIHTEFRFNQKATTVATPVSEVLSKRAGVCQDFAHLMIACLRQRGLAARYVSGYIETLPPPGQARLVGADASHAWVGVWCGDHGWLDIDPTNDQVPQDQHIITAWGRDYDDVIPLNGVIFGGGGKSSLKVRVDVERLQPD